MQTRAKIRFALSATLPLLVMLLSGPHLEAVDLAKAEEAKPKQICSVSGTAKPVNGRVRVELPVPLPDGLKRDIANDINGRRGTPNGYTFSGATVNVDGFIAGLPKTITQWIQGEATVSEGRMFNPVMTFNGATPAKGVVTGTFRATRTLDGVTKSVIVGFQGILKGTLVGDSSAVRFKNGAKSAAYQCDCEENAGKDTPCRPAGTIICRTKIILKTGVVKWDFSFKDPFSSDAVRGELKVAAKRTGNSDDFEMQVELCPQDLKPEKKAQ